MESLVELQKLEFDTTPKTGTAKAAIEKLRAQVPPQIIGHYDRLLARGKKGISLVKRNVCGECHMSVPIGTVVTILKGADIQLCGNCGRYLYAYPEPEEAAPAPAPVEAPKPKRKPRAKKQSDQQEPS
jgi:predicted  nucleic acid-binding Zn-ribbon protein